MGKIHFATSFLEADQLTEDLKRLPVGKAARWKEGMILKTPEGQFRLQELAVKINDPARAARTSLIFQMPPTLRRVCRSSASMV